MMRHYFLLTLLIYTFSSILLEGQATFQNAARFYEAEDENSAEESYKQLLTSSNDVQTQAAAHYGLGLVNASQKNWGDASSEFRQALSLNGIPLALKRDAQIALSEALIYQALENSTEPSLLAFSLDLLAEARRNFDDSKETHCLLWKSKGGDVCPVASYEGPLLKWLNSVEAEVSLLRQTAILHPASLLETVWQAQLALTSFKQDLDLIEELQGDPTLLKTYTQSFSHKIDLFLSLLENSLQYVPNGMRSSFEYFQNNIQQFQKNMNANSISAAAKSLQNAEKTLDNWLTEAFPDNPKMGALLQLMAYYEMALRSKILPENIVQEIVKIYESGRFKDSSQIILAQKYAVVALRSMQANKQTSARIYLEASQIILSSILLKVETPLRKTSDLLILALGMERNITKLTRMLAASAKDLAQEKTSLINIIAPAQNEVIKLLKQFPTYATQEQINGFKGTKETPGRCQHKPWDAVMPLFYAAWTAAESKPKSYIKNLQAQEKTLENLSAALKILLEPVAEGRDSCYTKGSSGKKPEPQPSEPKKDSPQPIENVMRQIQMMEQDDKINKPQSVMKVGEKPW